MSIETKHSPELRAYFKARGQPEDSPVWYPSSRELEQALELEVKAIVRQRSVVYSLNKKYADALFVVEQTRRVAEQAKQDAISALGELEKIIKEQEKK